MRILFITRHFNHSGYIILNRLIKEKFNIIAIVLHKTSDTWLNPIIKYFNILWYKFKCFYYNCEPLKNIKSEKDLAKRHRIKILWTETIKSDSFYYDLKKLNPDIIVLGGGWHELIPERVFLFPHLGCLNTHPSLLPEFRGTSITRWQLLFGLEKTGSTIHYVDENFDTGGILAQASFVIPDNATPQYLFKLLGNIGADLIVPLLKKFEEEGRQPSINLSHNSKYSNYYSRWVWSLNSLKINWMNNFHSIHFHVLANTQESYEYLGPYFTYNNHRYFLRKTKLFSIKEHGSLLKHSPNNYERKIIVIEIGPQGEIFLYRKDEDYILVLCQIQKFDRLYKIRRAYSANKILKLKICDHLHFEEYFNEKN
ncbi:MAG TPA: formyltransferase family protein [Spirochaetota bacterium]|nr:formyltransferase family protein [Spirochaetota bacterium]